MDDHQASSMKAGGFYGRVSGRDDVSLQRQLEIALEKAASGGYVIPSGHLYRYADNQITGISRSRSEWDRLMQVITTSPPPFDRLFIMDSSRLGRWGDPRWRPYIEVTLELAGVQIIFCDVEHPVEFSEGMLDSDVGQYLSDVIDTVNASRERTRIIRRFRMAKRDRVRNGFYPGGSVPYGYVRVLVHRTTGEVIREVAPNEDVRLPDCHFSIRPASDGTADVVRFVFRAIREGLPVSAGDDCLPEFRSQA